MTIMGERLHSKGNYIEEGAVSKQLPSAWSSGTTGSTDGRAGRVIGFAHFLLLNAAAHFVGLLIHVCSLTFLRLTGSSWQKEGPGKNLLPSTPSNGSTQNPSHSG